MFDQLKQLQQLKQLKDRLNQQSVTVEYQGHTITLNGNFEVLSLTLNPQTAAGTQLNQEVQELFNRSIRQLQTTIASSLSGSI